ncbi:hypothetical protein [uncultured Cohaesibacter sp.]|uniref:hypothetical protein n=1 Tax=uncultured Cohaesibacter sp. TaxID=1002546 RepID=UPI0029C72A90|nr:hypothetical protein [uncultured Cohaesibacter sp.]
MQQQDTMAWHARASMARGPAARQTALGIIIPVTLVGLVLGGVTAYDQGILEGLRIFGFILLIAGVLFGFSYLIAIAFIVPKGIRTAFLMNEDGIYSSADDELVEEIIAAGGAFGAATNNLTMMATPLSAKAGKAGHVPWDRIDSIVERPVQNYFVLQKGKRMVYANEDNYTDVRAFIRQHVAKAKARRDATQESAAE